MKAYLHAATSFVLPDPLTGRTGTEEALHCLTSGSCQPWTPLKKRTGQGAHVNHGALTQAAILSTKFHEDAGCTLGP